MMVNTVCLMKNRLRAKGLRVWCKDAPSDVSRTKSQVNPTLPLSELPFVWASIGLFMEMGFSAVCTENGGFLRAPIRNTCSLFFRAVEWGFCSFSPQTQPEVENTAIVSHNLDRHTHNITKIKERCPVFVSLRRRNPKCSFFLIFI